MTGDRFWFAEYDPEPPTGGYHWFAVLQLGGGMSTSTNTYWATEAACEEFIRDEILGAGARYDALKGEG